MLPIYTEAEELERYIRQVPSLKPRHCYFWDKENPFGAQRISTRTVPEPHEFAGISKEAVARFSEELDSVGTYGKKERGGEESDRGAAASMGDTQGGVVIYRGRKYPLSESQSGL
jgi:hypothetical protein